MTTTLYWRCGCGKVQLELNAEPWNVVNCHCHSCVASSRFLDEKYTNEEKHTSGLNNGGTSGAFFMPNDVTLLTEDLPLGCLKVGPKGKAIRKYAKCCGTQFGTVTKAFWGLNLSALYKDKEGAEKYAPEQPLHNAMKKFAFDPDQVTEPSSSIAPLGTILQLVGVVINPLGPSTSKEILEKLEVDPSTVEEVPITWE